MKPTYALIVALVVAVLLVHRASGHAVVQVVSPEPAAVPSEPVPPSRRIQDASVAFAYQHLSGLSVPAGGFDLAVGRRSARALLQLVVQGTLGRAERLLPTLTSSVGVRMLVPATGRRDLGASLRGRLLTFILVSEPDSFGRSEVDPGIPLHAHVILGESRDPGALLAVDAGIDMPVTGSMVDYTLQLRIGLRSVSSL